MPSIGLSGVQKSSFRLGILEGFSKKLSENGLNGVASAESDIIQKALVKFHQDPVLKNYLKEIYPRLTTSRNSSRMIDSEAFYAGHLEGQKLVLKKPLEASKRSGLFLSSKNR